MCLEDKYCLWVFECLILRLLRSIEHMFSEQKFPLPRNDGSVFIWINSK